jgi:hypothetical protein
MSPTQVTQFLYSLRKAYRELEVKRIQYFLKIKSPSSTVV